MHGSEQQYKTTSLKSNNQMPLRPLLTFLLPGFPPARGSPASWLVPTFANNSLSSQHSQVNQAVTLWTSSPLQPHRGWMSVVREPENLAVFNYTAYGKTCFKV